MDWIYLSKLIPLFLYPLNLFIILVLTASLCLLLGRTRTAGFLALSGFTLLIVCALPVTSQYLIGQLEKQYPSYKASDAPQADAILILGGAVALPQHPRVDLELVGSSDRIRYASQLYQQSKASKIVISGGNVFEQSNLRGEAYYIAQLLMEWGVPREDILFEEKSRNTYQNATLIKPLLQSNKLSKVLLVTSATHMPRAFAVFKAQGIDVIPAPTDILVTSSNDPDIFNWIPNAQALSSTTWILKEYLGWYYYKLRGYI